MNKKKEDDRRSKQIQVYLTPLQHKLTRINAQKEHRSISDYVSLALEKIFRIKTVM